MRQHIKITSTPYVISIRSAWPVDKYLDAKMGDLDDHSTSLYAFKTKGNTGQEYITLASSQQPNKLAFFAVDKYDHEEKLDKRFEICKSFKGNMEEFKRYWDHPSIQLT